MYTPNEEDKLPEPEKDDVNKNYTQGYEEK